MLVASNEPSNFDPSKVKFPPTAPVVIESAPVPEPIENVAFPAAEKSAIVIAPVVAFDPSNVILPTDSMECALKSPAEPKETERVPLALSLVTSTAPPNWRHQ